MKIILLTLILFTNCFGQDLLLLMDEGSPIYNPIPIKRAIDLIETQKVDLVGFGDSNQLKDGFGWDQGFQYALSQFYNMYATGLVAQSEGDQSGSGTGYRYFRIGNIVTPIGATSGAPAELEKYLTRGDMNPAYYTYVGEDDSVLSNVPNGLEVLSDCPLGITDSLTFRAYYGTFPSGNGNFKPYIRRESSPYTTLTSGAVTQTNTGSYGMTYLDLGVVANPARDYDISFKFTQQGLGGSFFNTYYYAYNPSRTTGFSYSTLDGRGGEGMRTMASDLQTAPDTTLMHFFSIIRDRQGANKKIIICVNSGLNDRQDSLTSVGTGQIEDGDSPEAFADNTQALITRINEVWTTFGWDLDELVYLIFVSHPVSNPDDAELISYREAVKDVCDDNTNVSAIDLTRLYTSDQIESNSWYLTAEDKNHLTSAGYNAIALKIIKALR